MIEDQDHNAKALERIDHDGHDDHENPHERRDLAMDNDDRDDHHDHDHDGNPQERRDHHLPRTRCSPRGKIVAA